MARCSQLIRCDFAPPHFNRSKKKKTEGGGIGTCSHPCVAHLCWVGHMLCGPDVGFSADFAACMAQKSKFLLRSGEKCFLHFQFKMWNQEGGVLPFTCTWRHALSPMCFVPLQFPCSTKAQSTGPDFLSTLQQTEWEVFLLGDGPACGSHWCQRGLCKKMCGAGVAFSFWKPESPLPTYGLI